MLSYMGEIGVCVRHFEIIDIPKIHELSNSQLS